MPRKNLDGRILGRPGRTPLHPPSIKNNNDYRVAKLQLDHQQERDFFIMIFFWGRKNSGQWSLRKITRDVSGLIEDERDFEFGQRRLSRSRPDPTLFFFISKRQIVTVVVINWDKIEAYLKGMWSEPIFVLTRLPHNQLPYWIFEKYFETKLSGLFYV